MDTVSHGAWSYLLWYASPYTWFAVGAGMLPDLLSVIPVALATFVANRGDLNKTLHDKNVPHWAAVYKRVMFPITHSLIVAMLVWMTVAAVWGAQWWLLAWPLHIVVDIVTHPREKATPFLWPLLGTKVHGVKWYGKRFMVVNTVALMIIAAIFWF